MELVGGEGGGVNTLSGIKMFQHYFKLFIPESMFTDILNVLLEFVFII